MTDNDSIIPDKMFKGNVVHTDRTKALEDISRKMGDIVNHMTGLMFMFNKLNEMYHQLGVDENLIDSDADQFAAMPPLKTSDVKAALDEIPEIGDVDIYREKTRSLFTISVTEVAESPIGPRVFSGIAHNEKGTHKVHGTITQVED
jgi:hypothetical protein